MFTLWKFMCCFCKTGFFICLPVCKENTKKNTTKQVKLPVLQNHHININKRNINQFLPILKICFFINLYVYCLRIRNYLAVGISILFSDLKNNEFKFALLFFLIKLWTYNKNILVLNVFAFIIIIYFYLKYWIFLYFWYFLFFIP